MSTTLVIHETETINILSTLRTLGQQIREATVEIRKMGNDPQNAEKKGLYRKQLNELLKKFWLIVKENKKALTAAGVTTAALASIIYGGAKFRKHQLAKKKEEETNESIDFIYNPFISEADVLRTVGNKVYGVARKPFERQRQKLNTGLKSGKITSGEHSAGTFKNQQGWRGKLARAAGSHQKLVGGATVAAGTAAALYGAHKLRQRYLKKKEAERQLNPKTEAKLIFYTELRNYIFENFDAIEKDKKLMKEGVNRAALKVHNFLSEAGIIQRGVETTGRTIQNVLNAPRQGALRKADKKYSVAPDTHASRVEYFKNRDKASGGIKGKLASAGDLAYKHKGKVAAAGAITAAAGTAYGINKLRQHLKRKKEAEKSLNKESYGGNYMSTELMLEFVLVEAMKKEGLLEKTIPLNSYLKSKGNTLSVEEASVILYLIDEVKKSAEKKILSETKQKINALNEAWVTTKDKELAAKANIAKRQEILKKAKEKLGAARGWAGQHKAATAGIAATGLAAVAGAKMLKDRIKRKKAEKEEELKKLNR